MVRFKNLSNHMAWRFHAFVPLGLNRFLKSELEHVDVVHVHEFRTLLAVEVERIAAELGVPYVLSAHGSLPKIAGKRTMKTAFDLLAGDRILAHAARVLALSKLEYRDYQSVGVPDSKISIVYNGLEVSDFEHLPTPGGFKRAYGLQKKRIVLYLGRINERKGLKSLVEAFEQLEVDGDQTVLVLAGPDDGYGDRLREMIRNSARNALIIATGYLPPERKLEALTDCDVVVYPSENEAFGLVPFEALMCGKPVVVTQGSGSAEILEETRSCLSVRPDDPVDLARSIELALGREGMTAMVERGKQTVRARLDWSRVCEQVERIYASVSG